MAAAAPLSQSVLVLGSGGMLGRAMVVQARSRGHEVTGADFPGFNLADPESVARMVDGRARLIINCAAYTDVDGAETHMDTARAINAAGVGALARCARKAGAVLVHFSTDYVFDGRGSIPYRPGDPKNPVNAYGLSKSEGEDALLASGAEVLLLRTSWLYAPWGKNFVRTIARLAGERPVLRVVDDQRGRPTSAEQLARVTLDLAAAGTRGVHHATDGGECSWFEFAGAIVEGVGSNARVEPCTSAEFPRPARRPAFSVLDTTSTETIAGPPRHWRESLADVLGRLEQPL